MSGGRLLAVASGLLGAVLVLRPHDVGRVVTARGGSVPAAWLVRLLGGRMAVQAAAELWRPDRGLLLAGAATDAAHAASMVPVALAIPRFRRAAVTSGAAAAANAAAAAVLVRHR